MTASEPVAALTFLMAGQVGAHDRRVQRFTDADRQHYLDLLSGLFVLCVDRRFRRDDDHGAVIRFVASVRERFDPERTLVDPTVAENLLLAALGGHDTLPATAENVTVQTLLTVALVSDEQPSPAGYDALLCQVDAMMAVVPSSD
ncbi:hypothetical protein O7608_13265 [Solwaraspora sp. WMMA2056]|uniref:hypothetical protein n=1 Tax=Solwaraspora sp. WMMA2056 TaxID=3015161 RepID=UPI00259B32EB|nr:hypothetical protein [Solwaraspora sp. WMMA2056]WJK43281.1 hypothetical protein O7608_13265 [Solwaraspora sp. WMMA2056]